MIRSNVTATEARCAVCLDTGSKSQQIDGYLDCTHCDATDKRIALRLHLSQFTAWPDQDTTAWAAYLFAQRQAAQGVAEGVLRDGECSTLGENRIDWLANCACAGGVAYPSQVKAAIRNALSEAKPVAAQPVGAVPQELRDIGELLRTQNNRITDSPIFIVQQKRAYVAAEGYDHDRIEWRESENGDYMEASPLRSSRLEAIFDRTGDEPNGWRRFAMKDRWEFVTACFTEQGCKDYIASNVHNLNEPRIYADGSYRNEEYRAVRKWLMSLDAAPVAGSAAPSGGALDLSNLTRFGWTEAYIGDSSELVEDPQGQYVKFADVTAITAVKE